MKINCTQYELRWQHMKRFLILCCILSISVLCGCAHEKESANSSLGSEEKQETVGEYKEATSEVITETNISESKDESYIDFLANNNEKWFDKSIDCEGVYVAVMDYNYDDIPEMLVAYKQMYRTVMQSVTVDADKKEIYSTKLDFNIPINEEGMPESFLKISWSDESSYIVGYNPNREKEAVNLINGEVTELGCYRMYPFYGQDGYYIEFRNQAQELRRPNDYKNGERDLFADYKNICVGLEWEEFANTSVNASLQKSLEGYSVFEENDFDDLYFREKYVNYAYIETGDIDPKVVDMFSPIAGKDAYGIDEFVFEVVNKCGEDSAESENSIKRMTYSEFQNVIENVYGLNMNDGYLKAITGSADRECGTVYDEANGIVYTYSRIGSGSMAICTDIQSEGDLIKLTYILYDDTSGETFGEKDIWVSSSNGGYKYVRDN